MGRRKRHKQRQRYASSGGAARISAIHQRLAGPSSYVLMAALIGMILFSLITGFARQVGTRSDTAGQPTRIGIARALGVTFPQTAHGAAPAPLVHVEFEGRDYMAPEAEEIGRIGPRGTPVRVEYARGKSGQVYVNRVLGPE